MSLNKDNRSSRRANGTLPSIDRTPLSQSEEFFTDSLLDASKIPSPSPKKQPFHKSYKERRAAENSRVLKSAWQSSKRSSFSDSDGTSLSSHLLRPTKLPSPARSPSPLRHIGVTSTPPPEISPTSPSIVSSPAHGLDETYKRIAEEEDIAAQEGQLEDEEYTDEMDHSGSYGYRRNVQTDNDSQTDGPTHEPEHAYNIGRDKENVPLDDGVAGTDVSGMSFLEELTDQGLAAKLTPHAVQAAKDRALLERASQRQTPINFKGVKNGPTLSERLQRRSTPEADDGLREKQQVKSGDHGDNGNDFQEPPPNVPKSWGKQRPGKERILGSRQRREHGRNGNLSSPEPDTSQVDWAAAAADVALPSVEGNSTPKADTSRNPSPASLHSQRSMDRIRQWELNDFTGQSLQVSDSPPVRPRTNVVDQIQQREIQRLEKQAVTTNRLGQYQRRDPNELIKVLSRRRSTSFGPATNTYPTPERSATPPVSGTHPALIDAGTSSAPEQKSKAVKFIQDGEAIPNTPVVVYKSPSSSSSSTSKQMTRPGHDRKASEDRLARLARALSNSPKPSSSPEDQSVLEPAKENAGDSTLGAKDKEAKEAVALDLLITNVVEENQEQARMAESSRQSSKQFAEEETHPEPNKIAETAKTPKVTGAWTDTILPDTVLRTIRKQENRPQHAQTPHISAGGWIETPAAHGKRQSSALAPIPIEEEEEDVPVPEGLTNGISKTQEEANPKNSADESPHPHAEAPKSALTTLLARAKARLTDVEGHVSESNDTLHLNDSTINSLEDLLTLDNAELTTLIRMGAESEAREQLIRDHLGAEPIAEAELLNRLSGKLNALRTNIHDARKGISKLEHQVATSPESSAIAQKSDESCEMCGSPPSTYLVSVNLPFTIPRLLHSRKPTQYLPRPTWLGYLTIMAWLWYFTEQAMADRYGHPLYTDHSYHWPSEPEPHFPWVLPTMLWRWTGRKVIPTLLGPFWWLLVAIFRVIGQALGWTDGFIDDGAMVTHGPSVGQVLGVLEDIAGMDADAFI